MPGLKSRYMESELYEQFCSEHLVESLTLLRMREANLLDRDLAALQSVSHIILIHNQSRARSPLQISRQ